MTDLDFFTSNSGPFDTLVDNITDGTRCFVHDTLGGYLGQGHVTKGRRGRAEAHFWFLGYTKDGPGPDLAGAADRILYLLLLIGEPAIGSIVGDWLPTGNTTTKMTWDTWTLSVEGGGADIRDNSCVGSDDENFLVCADVNLVGNADPSLCNPP